MKSLLNILSTTMRMVLENVFPWPYCLYITKFRLKRGSTVNAEIQIAAKKKNLNDLKEDLIKIYETEHERAATLDDKAKVIIGVMPLSATILIYAAKDVLSKIFVSSTLIEFTYITIILYFLTSAVILGLTTINVKGYDFLYIDDFQRRDGSLAYPSKRKYAQTMHKKIKYNETINLAKSNNIYLAMKSIRNAVITLFLYIITIFSLTIFNNIFCFLCEAG
jgi:putative ubiquitin-RnfH superfamily antitoxin RatB of RatAB toxin-antitoxin module